VGVGVVGVGFVGVAGVGLPVFVVVVLLGANSQLTQASNSASVGNNLRCIVKPTFCQPKDFRSGLLLASHSQTIA
jgi:hypothetical protein